MLTYKAIFIAVGGLLGWTAMHEAKKVKRGKVKKLKCKDDDDNEVTDVEDMSWGLSEELG